MPFYEYAFLNDDGSLGETFELMQSMKDDAFKVHPETGKPIKRLISIPGVATKYSEASDKKKLSDSNLDRLGFTKYEKSGDGTWDKRTGDGPQSISRD
jgi:predicted nucleic acid-binding Zn ribbon protein